MVQNNLIIKMGSKCSKNTSRWVHLGRFLNFYKKYRRLTIVHTEEKHTENLPSAEWWFITYAVATASEEINITFAKLQSQSLLVAQQQDFTNALIGTLTTRFRIKAVDPDEIDDEAENV